MSTKPQEKQAWSGLQQTSRTDSIPFPRANPRKSSFGSAIGDYSSRAGYHFTEFSSHQKHPYGSRSSFFKRQSFNDDYSESEFSRPLKEIGEQDGLDFKMQVKDETYSTSSSYGRMSQQKNTHQIDHFLVVVMGEEFDGVKFKSQPNTRFSTASLLKAPEANDLTLPDF